MKNTIKTSILSLAATALGLGACAPEVPANPTWQADIRPLMLARCIRCHDGAGHIDPATDQKTRDLSGLLAAYNFNYESLAEPLQSGLSLLRAQGKAAVRSPSPGKPIMPPPPAEKLEEWQIQMLDKWIDNPR